MAIKVVSKTVTAVELYKWLEPQYRLDVLPFAILYSLWVAFAVPTISWTDSLIVLGILAVVHILVILFTGWSVEFRCFATAQKVSILLVTGTSSMF